MIKNLEGITMIIMKPFANCLCKLGQDWYHIDFEATFIPGDYYPDYMDIQRDITEKINGKELNLEEAVDILYGILEAYKPQNMSVRAVVNKSTTHFPVEVIKEP